MSITNNKVQAPIRFDEVSSALGISQSVHDLGHLAQGATNSETPPVANPKINKWALHKPIRYNTLGALTLEMIASTHCGLSPTSLAKVKEMSLGWMSATYTQSDCLQEVSEWTYNPPRGRVDNGIIRNEWFRTLDFDGYNLNAIAPDEWRYVNVPLATLARYSELTLSATAGSNTYDFVFSPRISGRESYLTDSNFLFQNFSCYFGAVGGSESAGRWNWKTGMEIPINAVSSLSGCWRLALAVWVPNYPISGTQTGAWAIFSSRQTIYDYFTNGGATGSNGSAYTLGQALCPDFGTNKYALRLIQSYVAANNDYAELPCIPLLVENLWYDGSADNFMFRPNNDTNVYCMPSGTYFSILFGTEPEPVYYSISYNQTSSSMSAIITNIDADTHTFAYTMVRVVNGATTTSSGTVYNLAAGESRTIGAVPLASGQTNTISVTVTSQS